MTKQYNFNTNEQDDIMNGLDKKIVMSKIELRLIIKMLYKEENRHIVVGEKSTLTDVALMLESTVDLLYEMENKLSKVNVLVNAIENLNGLAKGVK